MIRRGCAQGRIIKHARCHMPPATCCRYRASSAWTLQAKGQGGRGAGSSRKEKSKKRTPNLAPTPDPQCPMHVRTSFGLESGVGLDARKTLIARRSCTGGNTHLGVPQGRTTAWPLTLAASPRAALRARYPSGPNANIINYITLRAQDIVVVIFLIAFLISP
jgi:hypothetical protein